MSDSKSNSTARLADRVLRGALRFWPRESGDWGRALAAELPSTAGSWEAIRWTMGGLMVLMREWLRRAVGSWKRPLGVPAGGPLEAEWKNAPRVPRTPRWVTALLLVASIGILLLPEVREAMGSVVDVWRAFASQRYYLAIPSSIGHFRKEASRTQDPQLLAFTAMLSEDQKERSELADKAVALDPSLTWIYFEVYRDSMADEVATLEAAKRLRKWDTDNAVAWLAAADAIFAEKRNASVKEGHGYDISWAQQQLEENPAWMEAMGRAFDAPRYDAYTGRVFDLYRTVAKRYKFRDPATALSLLSWSAIPNLLALRMYKTALFDRAAGLEREGNRMDAARLYWRVAVFGEEMRGAGRAEIEQLIGVALQKDAYGRLQPLLKASTNADEASLIRRELQTMEASVNQLRLSTPGWQGSWFGSLILHVLAASALLLAVMIAFAFGLLLKRAKPTAKGGGISCLIFDYCPVLLVFTLAALGAAYYPISRTFDLYLSAQGTISDFRGLLDSLEVPYAMEELLREGRIDFAVQFWIATIGILSLIAVYILFRDKFTRRRA